MERQPVLIPVPFADPMGVEPVLVAGAGRERRCIGRGLVLVLVLMLLLLVRSALEHRCGVRRNPRRSVVRLVAPHHRQRVVVVVGVCASTRHRSHTPDRRITERSSKKGGGGDERAGQETKGSAVVLEQWQ